MSHPSDLPAAARSQPSGATPAVPSVPAAAALAGAGRLVPVSAEEARLRADHDALAEQVATRRSVDLARRGFQLLFAGFLGVLLCAKLAWDRWGALQPGVLRRTPPGVPLYLYLAMAFAVVVLLLAIRAFLASRRLGRDEDAIFARVLALRAQLGLDR